jgi:hypothetical protein
LGREAVAGGADERLRLAEPLVSFLMPVSLEADQCRTLRQLMERRRSVPHVRCWR